ncbi:MAG: dihydroorotase [Polymorphobacter sp.]|uniref:dihydroorotase n=1 Tax=Polymorphobacter sp. TaxID=1909290 RepID=UPI003A8A4234
MKAPRPLCLTGGRVICPASGHDGVANVMLAERLVVGVGDAPPPADADVIDCSGLVVAPGLVDAGVFRADAQAFQMGGITRAVLMPDQSPPLDEPALVAFAKGVGKPHVWVHPLVAATRGLRGEELAELGLAREAGAVGVATGRGAIASAQVMQRLMAYAASFDMLVVSHAEELSLTAGAVASEGEYATRLGLASAPAYAEAMAVTRDLRLAEATGARLHFRQLTTAEALALVRAAQARGVRVSAGVTPAHWMLNETALAGFRSFARLSPPLRCEEDRLAVVDALADGTISVVASGHDPQSQEAKRQPFADAAPGMAGAETLLALGLSLVRDGVMALPALLAAMSTRPAALFGLAGGSLRAGEPADVLAFDECAPWRIGPERFAGLANTPFDGLPVAGLVKRTIKGGDVLWSG